MQTSTNRTNVRKALRLALSSPSEVIAMLKGLKNTRTKWHKVRHKTNRFVEFLVRLSLLTMTNPNQLCDVLLFVCSKMADETNLNSKLPVADRTREV